MQRIKLLLADDHHLFLEGIKSLLDEESSLEIVAVANNGMEVLDQLTKLSVDICILDINMPSSKLIINGNRTTWCFNNSFRTIHDNRS